MEYPSLRKLPLISLMSLSTAKLTKKQKKALAFRERRSKGKSKATSDDDNDIPIMEDQDLAEAEVVDSGVEGQEGGQIADTGMAKVVESKKRKREEMAREDENETEAKRSKTKKASRLKADTGYVSVEQEDGEANEMASKGRGVRQQRFILFIGNLKYTTTKEAIQEHFAKVCDPSPTIRLMTPKPSASGRSVTKSKGCAFLEFTAKPALQEALKLHHSTLEGRMINVELTAGGGGKSEGRTAKLKERNKELHEQRKKRLEKQKMSQDVEAEVRDLERPQRYSGTSGISQAPMQKRTWSIADETGLTAKTRGKKKSKKPPKPLGTGVNAIPVG